MFARPALADYNLRFLFVPATFSMTLMTTIALNASFRKRRRRGAFARQGDAAALLFLPHNPALRGLVVGAAVP